MGNEVIPMKKEIQLVFNRKIALQLNSLGYPITDIYKNRKKRCVDVYVFENTKDFQMSFANILNSK